MCRFPNKSEQTNLSVMSPLLNDLSSTMDPHPGYMIHNQPCGMMPQMPYHFDQGIPPCTPSHPGFPRDYRVQTGCLGPCSLDSGMDLRCMQRSILCKLDSIERGMSATEAIHTRITQMGRDIEGLKEKLEGVGEAMSELQCTVAECKGKISQSAEKLETVRVGLNDFAADMNTLVGSERDSQQGDAVGNSDSVPGLEAEKLDVMQYFDDKDLALGVVGSHGNMFERTTSSTIVTRLPKMSHSHEKALPPPPRPTPPKEALRPFTPYSSDRVSSSSLSSTTSSYSSSPSPSPLQPKSVLQGMIQQLESENTSLRNEIGTLRMTIQEMEKNHIQELTVRTNHLKKQNHQYHRQLGRQAELITNVVNTIYSVFADYKEEVRSMNCLNTDTEGVLTTEEVRVYNGLEPDSWL
ncbi:hypothetical protein NUW58_g8236 [Xylaria curta]|uniref:Uncharacterized protein n=1 Tax=Xylaria curta TaxID=42375 RepID=A0ACC1N9X2_9PEZI|nr:hypothetical protein NUW58_g8236 [Xylaria curta]